MVTRLTAATVGGMTGCLFCSIASGSVPALVVLDSPDVVAFLDIRPVFKGHVLVAPRTHVETLVDLPASLVSPLFLAVQQVAAAVEAGLGAGGTFVAINNRVSQSVPHLHVHVVPRTKGDGLRGFFWPRSKYASDDEALEYASKIAASLPASYT
jgi:histidine triad (HIT) family protein